MNEVTVEEQAAQSFLVQINFKSGGRIQAWFDKLDTEVSNGAVTSLTYKLSEGQKTAIAFISVTDIESIVRLDYKDIQ
jgi:hypothetical protein